MNRIRKREISFGLNLLLCRIYKNMNRYLIALIGNFLLLLEVIVCVSLGNIKCDGTRQMSEWVGGGSAGSLN